MLKLVRVAKSKPFNVFFGDSSYGINGLAELNKLDSDDNYRQHGEFFFVDERELEIIIPILAKENPGVEIQVYDLVEIGMCPAGDFVTKKVSKDGVLPNLSKPKTIARAEVEAEARAPEEPRPAVRFGDLWPGPGVARANPINTARTTRR